jgi:hypothetical protein
MKRRRPKITVPVELAREADRATTAAAAACTALDAVLRDQAPLAVRRAARADVAAAFADADRLLRAAAELTRPGPYHEWRQWRHRLSQLDLAKHRYLFAQSDDLACLEMGTVRAVDTGMSGPSIGELQHGASRPAGAAADYGLDIAAVMAAPDPAVVPQIVAAPVAPPVAPPSRQPVQPIAA